MYYVVRVPVRVSFLTTRGGVGLLRLDLLDRWSDVSQSKFRRNPAKEFLPRTCNGDLDLKGKLPAGRTKEGKISSKSICCHI